MMLQIMTTFGSSMGTGEYLKLLDSCLSTMGSHLDLMPAALTAADGLSSRIQDASEWEEAVQMVNQHAKR